MHVHAFKKIADIHERLGELVIIIHEARASSVHKDLDEGEVFKLGEVDRVKDYGIILLPRMGFA